ncbi:CAP domain-containing protein [Micromonospora sp. NPDC005367]|uniref:CAP domain-containing protein n=1 Tax=Micromonospora sp. NPDC005367 TaxID=3155590 RepID=UPI0033BC7B59
MEATGVYGWTDPNDPEGAKRRPEPPADGPAWLTDRPAPRSAYLFGDDPEAPADARHDERPPDTRHDERPPDTWRDDQPTSAWRDEPTGRWASEPVPPVEQSSDAHRALPTDGWSAADASWSAPHHGWSAQEPGHRPTEQTGGWRSAERPGSDGATDGWSPRYAAEQPAYGVRPDRWDADPTDPRRPAVDDTAQLHPVSADEPDGRPRNAPAQTAPEGRHRSRRRIPRPLLIGGAAAAATLVVSLGVGAITLPGGGGGEVDATAVDDTVAAAPVVPTDAASAPATTSASPTASPSTVRPTPSASRTTRPTPSQARTTAPSRRSVERSSTPSGGGATNPPSGNVSAQAREVVDLVNAERAKAGCKALSIDDKLMTAAQRHSQDQADHKNMSHTGSDGSDPGDRIERVGYQWRTYGENVAWNQKTPAAVMDAWMNSPGHRANILNCAFTEIGVGIASSNGPYWTQVFAAPR